MGEGEPDESGWGLIQREEDRDCMTISAQYSKDLYYGAYPVDNMKFEIWRRFHSG